MKRSPQTEEARQRASASAKAYWADPAVRKAHGEKTRARMDRPEVRARIIEGMKKAILADPGIKSRQIDGIRRAFADPALRQKVSQRTKAAMAAKLDRQFADLIKVWSETPEEVRRRFVDYARASWGAEDELNTIRSATETLAPRRGKHIRQTDGAGLRVAVRTTGNDTEPRANDRLDPRYKGPAGGATKEQAI